jgi:hypothetical protein
VFSEIGTLSVSLFFVLAVSAASGLILENSGFFD